MAHCPIQKITEIMKQPESIRNIVLISQLDYGKTTLADSFVAKSGIMPADKISMFMSTREDEQMRGITIKSAACSLYYELSNKQPFLVNLLDSPGHADFMPEVTASLRISDGAILIVDIIEGIGSQSETLLRESMLERVKPIMFINKIDRVILELQLNSEEIYNTMYKIISSANTVIATYDSYSSGNNLLSACNGTVIFGSALHGWAFTIQHFAQIYSAKFGIDQNKMCEKFWGNWFYDSESKSWITSPQSASGKTLTRGFNSFIMDPIIKINNLIMSEKSEDIPKILSIIGITLSEDDKALTGKPFLKRVMQKWINLSDSMLEIIVAKLPSPIKAQQYRMQNLYSADADDMVLKSMMQCNPQGPLMIYISKMVPAQNKESFYALGRVFSGTVKSGQKCIIYGPNYIKEETNDKFVKNIENVLVLMGRDTEQVTEIPCGNIVGLTGIDKFIVKTATVTDYEDADIFKTMKYSASPIMKVVVRPKNPEDLPKLVEGLKKLAKSDPLVQCTVEESGDHIIAGCGELHLETCINDLKTSYANIDLAISEPYVSFMETVTEKSSQICLSKSPNKHNRLYATAQPLDDNLVKDIENKIITTNTEQSKRNKLLASKYDWDIVDARKIWGFGPLDQGPNVLVDSTKAVQFLYEVKDSINSSFQWVTKEAVLTDENMRGVRFDLLDAQLTADSLHRGAGQIIPSARRLFYASQLTATPRLQEPFYEACITATKTCIAGIYSCLNNRRAVVISEESLPNTPLILVKAYLPVAESLGFTAHLRSVTSGQAFPQCVFNHWETILQDPLDSSTRANQIVVGIRKRKGLSTDIPELDTFLDKL